MQHFSKHTHTHTHTHTHHSAVGLLGSRHQRYTSHYEVLSADLEMKRSRSVHLQNRW